MTFRADERRDDEVLGHDTFVDDAAAHCLRDRLTRERPHEIQDSGHEDGLQWREHTCRDDRCDGVGCVMEAVDEFERDPQSDDERQENGRVIQLAVLHHDRLDDVRDILAAVDGDLDQ